MCVEAFNLPEALRRVGGETGFLREILTTFIEDYPVTMRDLREALSRGDREALTFSAHKLKGALATISAEPAHAAAIQLEQVGSGGDLQEANEALSLLERKIDALLPALRRWQSELR